MPYFPYRRNAANDGHPSRAAVPRTLEDAGRMFRERGLELPQSYNDMERAAVEYELRLAGTFPGRESAWYDSDAEWEDLHHRIRRAIDSVRRRIDSIHPPPSRSSDDGWEYPSPARNPSHQRAASGRGDRAGGLPSNRGPYYASNSGSSDWRAIPPLPYSSHPGARPARRGHSEVPETARRNGGYTNGASRGSHGNSRHYEDRNPAYSRANSGEHGTSTDRDASASPRLTEDQYMEEFERNYDYMRPFLSQERRDIWRFAVNYQRSILYPQQSDPLPNGRRGGR